MLDSIYHNMEIIADGVPKIEEFMQEVLPDVQADGVNDQTDILPDIDRYLEQDE